MKLTLIFFLDKTKITVAEQKNALAEKKKAEWEKEKQELIDTKAHYLTTKVITNQPIEEAVATGTIKDISSTNAEKTTQLKWGDFTRDTQKYLAEIQQLNLRKPIDLVVSPFAPKKTQTQK